MSKCAVVLAGGGSRGAYQIGVWKALREEGKQYDIVTGTSVGALNGAMMVQGDYDKALQVWQNLSPQDVVGKLGEQTEGRSDWEIGKIFARQVLETGGADITTLEHFIKSLVDEERFFQSSVDFALVTVEYPSLKPLELKKKDISRGMLGEYLLASAACFPAFQIKEINGQKYMDGGYHDNMPINLAIKMGADEIIAVDLESVGMTRKIKKMPQKMTLIRSLWPLGSFLKFDSELACRNIRLGYLDGRKALGKSDGQLYTFVKDTPLSYAGIFRKRMEILLEQAKRREPKFAEMMHQRILRRMMREFLRRFYRVNQTRPFTLSMQVIMAAEYLGEALEIEPDCEYEFGEFVKRMEEAVKIKREEFAAEDRSFSEGFDLQSVGEDLQKLDRFFLVSLIRERLERFLIGEAAFTELVVASAFWKEFVAAIFLYLLDMKKTSSNL